MAKGDQMPIAVPSAALSVGLSLTLADYTQRRAPML